MNIKRITASALLTALSLAFFSIELLMPPFPFCPAAKIGLANTISLFMITNPKRFKLAEVFTVVILRCILASLVTGRLMSVLFSLCGGAIAVLVMFATRFFLGRENVVIISVAGAIFHNLTQIFIAVLIYGTMSAFYYIPSLFIAGVISGALIGLCVRLLNKNGFINKF